MSGNLPFSFAGRRNSRLYIRLAHTAVILALFSFGFSALRTAVTIIRKTAKIIRMESRKVGGERYEARALISHHIGFLSLRNAQTIKPFFGSIQWL